jgi:hypothetical protein
MSTADHPMVPPSQDQPVTTTTPDLDGLYQLAWEELRRNTVSFIQDGAFNHSQPIPCPAGGCFQAGQKWTYVWTRDTSYAVHLALAPLQPLAARNSLLFKTSPRRDGTDPQIVQDTGTGGSYPISSDRVVWALAAAKLLHFLTGEEKATFVSQCWEVVKNTIAHDRVVLFDEIDGLYTGEQSFLDWRQQSYPEWVANDVVHIGMSKCLSTNLLHFNILNFGAELARDHDPELALSYQAWAAALKQAIQTRFYLPDKKLFATFLTTQLDGGPAHQYDLLGSVLAILLDVATPEQAAGVLANYPVLPSGPPVIWPQQQYTPIYHNRAIWPFATAYWLKAAHKVGLLAAVSHGMRSLIEGVKRLHTNSENFEMVSGASHVDEGATSGPVVNSPAQLWSIAGYLSMVHDILFGLDFSDKGLRFRPLIPADIRQQFFADRDSLSLHHFPYLGRLLQVTLHLPDPGTSVQGGYTMSGLTLNGVSIDPESFLTVEQLQSSNHIEIQLVERAAVPPSEQSICSIAPTAEWRHLFAPRHPVITSLALVAGKVKLVFHANGENPDDIAFNLYRDGQLVQEGLPGSMTEWVDADTTESSPSYCYTMESYFKRPDLVVVNYSQKSPPCCYWGWKAERIQEFRPPELSFEVDGQPVSREISYRYGYPHYENWGDPKDTLVLPSFRPAISGTHLLQVSAANGSGPVSTGITCGVKYLSIYDDSTGSIVGSGYLKIPQISCSDADTEDQRWSYLRNSSFVRATLQAGESYRVVISEDAYACNMSSFQHFALYNHQGGSAPFNRVNVASLKIMALSAQP